MIRRLLLVACSLLFAACAGEELEERALDVPSGASSGGSSDGSTDGPSVPADATVTHPVATVDALFSAIDGALAQETSVRQDMGNLNPPPASVLRQEYGGGEDDFVYEFVLEMDGRSATLGFARADGAYFMKDFESDLWQPAPGGPAPDDDSAVAQTAHSDVREDFQRYGAMTAGLRYVGEERVAGQPAHHYTATVRLAELRNPSTLPSRQRGSKPIDLWIAPSGLPVRVEVRYSEPLGGTPGTGVSRTDYSEWSEPVDPDLG